MVEQKVVSACVPHGPGERNQSLWELARSLKGLPHLADADADDLRPFVESWFEAAQSAIRTRSFKVCWDDFRRQWRLARRSPVEGFDRYAQSVLADPPPPEADQYPDAPTRNLVAVCVGLQRYARSSPFFLSCRTAQRVCGFRSHMTASRRLKEFVRAGMLVLVRAGRWGEKSGQTPASEYRWTGSTGAETTTAVSLASEMPVSRSPDLSEFPGSAPQVPAAFGGRRSVFRSG